MGLFNRVPSIPAIKPMYNVGCLFDIPTGTYHQGARGESILNGGMGSLVSIAGPGNSFKSSIALYWQLTLAERLQPYKASIYDTENSLSYDRLTIFANPKRFPKMASINHGDETLPIDDTKFIITSSAELMGDEYFNQIKEETKEIIKDKHPTMYTLPIRNSKLEHIKVRPPFNVTIDSLSELKVTAQETGIVDKNNIGDSGNNMLYMRQGIAKKQLITQLPNISSKTGFMFTMVAHVGDEFDLGGMFAPQKHKLTHSKRGSKITGTTKAFEFINNVLYEIFSSKVLHNKDRKTGVLYPLLDIDRVEGCIDLMLVTLKITRNKSGASGVELPIIISQREGLLPHLTQFHYIKEANWGISGNDRTYRLDLVPDVTLQRTTVRGIIDDNPNIKRALEIECEMLQIKELWSDLKPGLMCTPAELYDDLKTMGYDWDELLNTRTYFVFMEHEEHELPLLSTLDLLRMRTGEYKPYWKD